MYLFLIIQIFILFIILYFSILYRSNKYKKIELFEKSKNAFCLLVKQPNIIWLNFLNTMIDDYDVFICVDILDDYSELKNTYINITFIEITDELCLKSNYINSNYLFKLIVASDRAFYYFNHVNNNYNHIWFCEDDVYFDNVNIIKNLDNKYPNADILSNEVEFNTNGDLTTWPHWHTINNTFSLPWAKAMICLVRLSNNLLRKVDEFIIKNKQMIFIETMFHTLAIHNNMIIKTPDEMTKIYYRHNWSNEEIINNKNYIYHPMKNIDNHLILRQ